MGSFDDLTPYSYGEGRGGGEGQISGAMNVGWLGEGIDYSVGAVPDGFLGELVRLCRRPVNLTRGIHFCTLCPRLTPDEYRKNWNSLTTFHSESGDVMVGNGEIRVVGASGAEYFSPTMIVHYVAQHNYCPPDDFIIGVMQAAGYSDWRA